MRSAAEGRLGSDSLWSRLSGTALRRDVRASDTEQQQNAAQQHLQVVRLRTFDRLAGDGPLAKPEPAVYFIWATVGATADDGEVLTNAQPIMLLGKPQRQSADLPVFYMTASQHRRVQRHVQHRVATCEVIGRLFRCMREATQRSCVLPRPSSVPASSSPAHTGRGLLGS